MPVLRHGVEHLMVSYKLVSVLHYRVEPKYRCPVLYTFPQLTLNECLAPSDSFPPTFPKFRCGESPVFNTSPTQLTQTDTSFQTAQPKVNSWSRVTFRNFLIRLHQRQRM